MNIRRQIETDLKESGEKIFDVDQNQANALDGALHMSPVPGGKEPIIDAERVTLATQ